ncbi:MAG TPA: maleylacetoacetate isomerase [Azospira sp.]|nr:maleylacetoacetate isomerase [Azospira sp.]HNN08820.1 maleylacetoacetate isomerase [Azospira sp.]HNN45074.1 maleylacetoacetate isomerase [Azospira sp.]
MLKLYTYFRSSAAYRVRIALNLKNLEYEAIPVHLVKDGGQHLKEDYRRVNPAGAVPALADRELSLSQSLAIIEYLDEAYPYPPLLPADPAARARVRAIALDIACEIHPINNLRVLKYLTGQLGLTEEQKNAWYRHWVEVGLASVESRLTTGPNAGLTGKFCHGDHPTLADCCLVPQVFNARRFGCRLDHVPTVVRIDAECRTLPAFVAAAPENQPDAE